jgi:hypothetical protein
MRAESKALIEFPAIVQTVGLEKVNKNAPSEYKETAKLAAFFLVPASRVHS